MYKLTDNRFLKAEHVLEIARQHLVENGSFDTTEFEHRLKEIWSVSYREIKDLMLDLLRKYDRYKYVAVFYMENSNSLGVNGEFKEVLAKEYGISHYHSESREVAMAIYWEKAKNELAN